MLLSRKASLFLALPALLLGASESRATFAPLPSTVTIGTQTMNVPVALGSDNKSFVTNGSKDFIFKSADGLETITVNATGNPDPFLSYSFSAQNTSNAPVAFAFTFATPIVTTPANTLVTSTLSGSLTAGDADGVTVSPNLVPGGVTEASINGSPVPALAVGPTQTSPTGVNVYGPFSASTTSAAAINSLDVTVSFTLTGGGDQFAGSGLVTTGGVVPEPTSMALMGIGTLSLGYVMRRKLIRDRDAV